MHGKIMKDFLALFRKQMKARCYFNQHGTLGGLYIGKPKYRNSCTNFKFRGRGIGFYWQWSPSIVADSLEYIEFTYGENGGLPIGINVADHVEFTKEDEVAFITKHTRFFTPYGSKIENFVPVSHSKIWV